MSDDRYLADLFYIAPMYHLALTSLEKIIVMDATDLEFHGSIELLQVSLTLIVQGFWMKLECGECH